MCAGGAKIADMNISDILSAASHESVAFFAKNRGAKSIL
jgi:hypothetical protein